MKHPKVHGEFARWLALQSPADLRVLARGWKLAPTLEASELAAAILAPDIVQAQWERLGEREKAALRTILAAGGTLPVAIMERTHGRVRDLANFPNARSYLESLSEPSSAAERLYLLGLITRQHDERGQIFKVPSELMALLPSVPRPDLHLQVATQPAPAELQAGLTTLVEQLVLHLLTLTDQDPLQTLADGALNKKSMLRVGAQFQPPADLRGVRREVDWPWLAFVRSSVVAAGLLHRTADGLLHVTATGEQWLRAPLPERIQTLLNGWIASPTDDLTLLGGLRWRSTPYGLNVPTARRALLRLLATLPPETWLSLPDVIGAVQAVDPYFLRRDGRFDTWLLYDHTDHLVSGEGHWEIVEGGLVEYVLGYALHWLGLTDVASDTAETPLLRLTQLGAHLLTAAPAPPLPPPASIVVQSTFEVVCPPQVAPYAHFQLTRVAERLRTGEVTIYKLTRKALLRAAERDITGEEVLTFLRDASESVIPPAVEYSIREWSGQAGQVTLESAALLRADPVLLAEIRRSKAVKLPTPEELRPDVWRVPEGDATSLAERLKEAGFGVAATLSNGTMPLSEHDLKALVSAAYTYSAVCDELGLPCEISAAMLVRLQKLVPSRHGEAAFRAAHDVRTHIKGLVKE